MKYRVAICGDSWMSPSSQKDYLGTHFSELLCKEQNWQLEWYARPGSSNGGICVQIEEAIHDKCDLILFGTTTYNRTEYTLEYKLDKDPIHLWEGCDKITLSDIAPPSQKVNNKNNEYEIVSDNIMGILNKDAFYNMQRMYSNLSEEEIKIKYNVFKEWFMHIYHPGWKQKLDRWCLHAVLQKVRESNIPCECVIDFVGMPDTYWIDKPILGNEWLKGYAGPDNGPTYHTTIESQVKILNLVKPRLKNKGILIVD